MADESKAVEAPNRCDVEAMSNAKPEPTMLTMFAPPMETPDFIDRTARYSCDPEAYLQSALGPDFEARRHLLSLPQKVDRDMYGTGTHKAHFEAHIAQLMGKPHGLFYITGVQAQLAALKIHCGRAENARVAWHVTSHLEEAEMGAWRELYGLERTLVGTRRDALPSVEDIRDMVNLPEEERPAVLLIEVPNRTLGCATYGFEELEEISRMCQAKGVKVHCDGARLWEIEPYYARTSNKSFPDICAFFDTVYVSFYKGLAGVTGAMLLCPDEAFHREAKMWQRRAGGNAMTLMYEVIDSERGFNENIGTFDRKWWKMVEVVKGIKEATAEYRTDKGEAVVSFVVDPPTCAQGKVIFRGFTTGELDAARDTVQEKLNVRAYNRLWPKKTLDEKMKAEMDGGDGAKGEEEDDRIHSIEWMMMSVTEKIETKTFVDAYAAFCEALLGTEGKSASLGNRSRLPGKV